MKEPNNQHGNFCTDVHELDPSISPSAVDIPTSRSDHPQLNSSYYSWDERRQQHQQEPPKPTRVDHGITENSKNLIFDSAEVVSAYHSAEYSLADDSSDRQSIGSKRQHYSDSLDENPAHHEVAKKRMSSSLRRIGTRTDDRYTNTNIASELKGIGGMSSVSGMSYATANSSVGGASGFSMMSNNGSNSRTAGRSSQGHMEDSFLVNHPSYFMGPSPSGQINSLPTSSRMPFASSSFGVQARGTGMSCTGAGSNRIMHTAPSPSSNLAANRNNPMNTGAQVNAQELLIPATGAENQQQQHQQILNYQATVPPNFMGIGGMYTPMLFGQQHQQLYSTNANSIPVMASRQFQYGTTLHAEAYMNQFLSSPYNPGFAQTSGNSQPMHYFQGMCQAPGRNFSQSSTTYQQVQHPNVTSSGPDQIEPYSSREIMNLASEGDSIWLSNFLCFLREHCCEVFTATKKDVQERRKSKQINLNQVGIRCRFCAHQPHSRRIGRSSCYPTSVERIYQSVTMMIREHFPVCDEFPDDVRRRYTSLKKSTKKGEMESKTHWKKSARSLGMIDTPKGIYFDENIVKGRLDQQQEAGDSNNGIGNNKKSGEDDDAAGGT